MEIDSDLHQDILDAGFAKEAMEAGDVYVRVAGPSDERSRWRALMKASGMEETLARRLAAGEVAFLATGRGEEEGALTAESVDREVCRLCRGAGDRRVRVEVDIARLLALLPAGDGYSALVRMTSGCRGAQAVVLGVVSPQAVSREELEKLRTAADGIVRLWTEGNYSYLQVAKTVNAARTPVYAINQIAKPPFIEIMPR